MSNSPSNSMTDAELARRMFFGGCAALPFLWVVNVLQYRKQVFGEISWLDKTDEQEEQHNTGGSRTIESSDENVDTTNDSDNEHNEALRCWVKRSFYSSIVVTSLFITWILVFQLNKDSFGERWFVVDVANPTDRTGW